MVFYYEAEVARGLNIKQLLNFSKIMKLNFDEKKSIYTSSSHTKSEF